jgi:hypothetical protein
VCLASTTTTTITETSTTATLTSTTSSTTTSSTTTLDAVSLRELNINATYLRETYNMSTDELISKGFNATELLGAGVTCSEVEREFGPQKPECGNNGRSIVGLAVTIALMAAVVIGVLWYRKQSGEAGGHSKVERRRTDRGSRQRQRDIGTPTTADEDRIGTMATQDPTFSEEGYLQVNTATTNAEYDAASSALTFATSGSVIISSETAVADGTDAESAANANDARRPSYSIAVDTSGRSSSSAAASVADMYAAVSRPHSANDDGHLTAGTTSATLDETDELNVCELPPAGRGQHSQSLSAGSAARCQRPSPREGTCKKNAARGSKFCEGHTCAIVGCTAGKSAKAHNCPEHSTAASKRDRTFSVTLLTNGNVRLHSTGAEMLPTTGTLAGAEHAATYKLSVAADDAAFDPRQRLKSAASSSSPASDYSLVPLAPAVRVHSSEREADVDNKCADEWAENAAQAIGPGGEGGGSGKGAMTTDDDSGDYGSLDHTQPAADDSAATNRRPTLRENKDGARAPAKERKGISRGSGGRHGSVYNGFTEYFEEHSIGVLDPGESEM